MAIVKLNAEYRPFLSLLPLLLQYYLIGPYLVGPYLVGPFLSRPIVTKNLEIKFQVGPCDFVTKNC